MPPIGPSEAEGAVPFSFDVKPLFVDRAVVAAAQHGEARERRRSSLRRVFYVVSLTEGKPTAGEATTVVAMVQRSAYRRRNRPRTGTNLHHVTVGVVSHDDAARVARQAPRRFRGNVRAAVEDGLSGLIRIRQYRGTDVHHDLIAFSRCAGIEPGMQGRFREQRERVGLLLGDGRGVLNAKRLMHCFTSGFEGT